MGEGGYDYIPGLPCKERLKNKCHVIWKIVAKTILFYGVCPTNIMNAHSAMLAFLVVVMVPMAAAPAFSQDGISLATFHESALVLIDRAGSQNVTASVTLQSISTHEMQIPQQLEQRIRGDGSVTAVILTNHDRCVLGVTDQACIIINTERSAEDRGITAVQESARKIGDSYIDDINKVFDTKAGFHSVFIDVAGAEASTATQNQAAGRVTVSTVYTMPMEDTAPMYEKISGMLMPAQIRDAGGFHEAAKTISGHESARMSFSMVPLDSTSLMQLKVIHTRPVAESMQSPDVIRPLELLGVDALERSSYFASGFYPLNSVVQVALSSADDDVSITDTQGGILPTRVVDGDLVPTDVTSGGWVFEPDRGRLIEGKYIFGTQTLLLPGDLEFSLGAPDTGTGIDEQAVVVIIIVAVAAAAALYYLKGYARARDSSNK